MVKLQKSFLLPVSIFFFVVAGTIVEAKTNVAAKLLQSNVLTYLSRILVNPTDATDGTVKRAAALTQSCSQGKALQGFDSEGKISCVDIPTSVIMPATKPSTTSEPAAPKALPPHLEGRNGSFGCSTIRDHMDNYIVSCNSSLGKVCLYVANSDYIVGNWYCGNPSGFNIAASTTGCYSTVEESGGSNYVYKVTCSTNAGKVCSYVGSTNGQGGLTSADWKCMQMTETDKFKDFR